MNSSNLACWIFRKRKKANMLCLTTVCSEAFKCSTPSSILAYIYGYMHTYLALHTRASRAKARAVHNHPIQSVGMHACICMYVWNEHTSSTDTSSVPPPKSNTSMSSSSSFSNPYASAAASGSRSNLTFSKPASCVSCIYVYVSQPPNCVMHLYVCMCVFACTHALISKQSIHAWRQIGNRLCILCVFMRAHVHTCTYTHMYTQTFKERRHCKVRRDTFCAHVNQKRE